MKTMKETMKILKVGSRTTMYKIMEIMNVTPHVDEKGWNYFSDDDIAILKQYRPNYNPPVFTKKLEKRKVKQRDTLKHDVVTVGNIKVNVTPMTEHDREEIKHLASLYETQGIASRNMTINKVRTILNNYVD